MDSRHTTNDKQRYTDAGEQAAKVIGDFMSMANEFSKKFEESFNSPGRGAEDASSSTENIHVKPSEASNDQNVERDQVNENWLRGGEYLRELREAAGYTIDSFAKAMNRQDAVRTVSEAEAGREMFPKDWFDQAVEVLQHNDPLEFFTKLRDSYELNQTAAESVGSKETDAKTDRQQQLNALFSDEEALQNLTDSQFDELKSFMQTNYHAALQLVRKK